MVFAPLISLFPILLFSYAANAHGVMTAISGANGVTAQGFGVIASTPRTGSSPVPFEVSKSCTIKAGYITDKCYLFSKIRPSFAITRSKAARRAFVGVRAQAVITMSFRS